MPQSPNKKRRVETDPVGKKSKPRSTKNSREKADINTALHEWKQKNDEKIKDYKTCVF